MQKFANEECFVKDAEFLKIAEYLFDYRLKKKENEVLLLSRIAQFMSLLEKSKADVSLESRTLLFYMSKYGLCEKAQVCLCHVLKNIADDEIAELAKYPELVKEFIVAYACRQDFCEQARPLIEELTRTGVLTISVPEEILADRAKFRRKDISQFIGYLRFIGVMLD